MVATSIPKALYPCLMESFWEENSQQHSGNLRLGPTDPRSRPRMDLDPEGICSSLALLLDPRRRAGVQTIGNSERITKQLWKTGLEGFYNGCPSGWCEVLHRQLWWIKFRSELRDVAARCCRVCQTGFADKAIMHAWAAYQEHVKFAGHSSDFSTTPIDIRIQDSSNNRSHPNLESPATR